MLVKECSSLICAFEANISGLSCQIALFVEGKFVIFTNFLHFLQILEHCVLFRVVGNVWNLLLNV